MQIVLNLEKESIQDLQKCISILNQVIYNKQNSLPLTNGLDQHMPIKQNGHAPQRIQQCQEISSAAQKLKEQQELMDKIDLSEMLRKNFK